MTPPRPADAPGRAPTLRVLLRALRERCPACGHGRIFHHGLRSETRCDACGWWFERGPGHWIGGSEINMIVTYWAASLTFVGANLVFGFSWVTLVLAAAFVFGFSLLIHKKTRALFFALDYLVDPHHDPSEHHDGGRGGGAGEPRPHPVVPRSGAGVG